MRIGVLLLALVAVLAAASAAAAQLAPPDPTPATGAVLTHYRAYDGRLRPALILLPAGYHGQPIPLVISPHGRGVNEWQNAQLWGDLPTEGGFAVINPGGEGRRTEWYSWGAPGQIDDLARMPQIAQAAGVNVDPHRVYAIGGSMGAQETLLLLAHDPRLLAGAAAFDPATDMSQRYRDFAALPDGRWLQALARLEVGGTPAQDPSAYAQRSPDTFVRQLAFSGVPLQLYWSTRDRIIADQPSETGRLATEILELNPHAKLWNFEGQWSHSAEMTPTRRLPRALVRFGLLPWRDVPSLPPTPAPQQTF